MRDSRQALGQLGHQRREERLATSPLMQVGACSTGLCATWRVAPWSRDEWGLRGSLAGRPVTATRPVKRPGD